MNKNQIKIEKAQAHWNVTGTRILKYTVDMYHEGLNERKLISAPEEDILENKVNLQVQRWNDKWDKRLINLEKEANLEEANLRTEAAIKSFSEIENLLIHTLSIDDRVDWESLKKNSAFSEKVPVKPIQKIKKENPPKPEKQEDQFTPVFTFVEKLFKSKKEKKIQDFENKYSAAILEWEKQKITIDDHNTQLDKSFEIEIKNWEHYIAEWEKRKNNFLQKQNNYNKKIDQMKESYLSQDITSIIEYCEMVLNNSDYPDSFPKNFEIEYSPDNRILILEYELPSIECFPKVKDVKYIASRKELKESYIPESQINKMFDDATYKITLRTIHELFEADVANALDVNCHAILRKIV